MPFAWFRQATSGDPDGRSPPTSNVSSTATDADTNRSGAASSTNAATFPSNTTIIFDRKINGDKTSLYRASPAPSDPDPDAVLLVPQSPLRSTPSRTLTPISPSPEPATPIDTFPSKHRYPITTATKPIDIVPSEQNSPRFLSAARHGDTSPGVEADQFVLFNSDYSDLSKSDFEMTTGPAIELAMGRSRNDSFVSAGPKPINMANSSRDNGTRQRRESIPPGSLMGGSWNTMSVGSFVKDEMAMRGVPSSFGAQQSPSSHSTSYLPRLEANFMRDFACCGVTWPDFHKLLEHWEQSHNSPKAVNAPTFSDYAQLTSLPATSIMANPRTTQSSGLGQLGGRVAGSMGQQNRQPANFSGGAMSPSVNPLISGSRQTLSASSAIGHSHSLNEDLESVADMEMDDAVGPMEMDDGQRTMLQTRQLFGQASRPQLQINASNISQALRTSQPPTPAAASFGLQHNPTVSSVNTPTLTTQHFQRSQPSYLQTTAASAVADDDDEMDEDLPGLPMATDLTGLGFGRPADETSTTIANPGANLSTPTGGMTQRQQLLAQMAIEQNPALLHQLSIMQHQEEHKPYKCPVIGCEKAYKNQNGLKYHKVHGHATQTLHENSDGTFSILNPENNLPYPGATGMEKQKPYSCDHCGKRYKNNNGLKYHKSHAPYCNPESLFVLAAGGTLGNVPHTGEDPMQH